MADIDNLNFSVLLDDAKFKKTIEDDKRLAREFNADLSQILDFKGKLGKGIKIIEDAQSAKVGQVADGVKAIKKEMEDLKGKTVRVTGEYEKQSGILRELGSIMGAYLSVRGVEQFLSSLVRVTGEFEVQKMALTSMLGSAEVADEIFTTLRQSALESPYTFQDLTKYAKQLTAFNIDADKLVETEKMLADVSAGLGVDMGRIILAYGQVKAAGVLKGTELRQFTEAGVPLLQSLADQIERTEGKAIALSEVFSRISKKEIPFEMVEQAFRDMTSEGGKFYNMQEVLVQTLQGKIGKLRDVWQQALYDMGNANSSTLKGAVDFLTKIASHIDFIVKLLAPLVAGIGAYAAVAAVAWSLSKVQAVGQFVNYLLQLVKSLNAATAATAAFGAASGVFATTAGAIGAVVGVLAALGVGIYEVSKAFNHESEAMRIVNKTTASYNAALQTELSNARALLNTMGKLKQGTEEYDRAKDALLNKYGEYLSDLDKEKIAVGNLAGVYDNLHTSIINATKARFKEQGMADLGKSFADSTQRIFKRVQNIAQGRIGRRAGGDSNDLEAELIAYVTGQSDLAGLSESGQRAVRMADIDDSPMGRGLTHLRNAYAKAEGIVREGEQRLNKVFGESVMQTLIAPNSDGKGKWDANWQQSDDTANKIRKQIELLRTFRDAYKDLENAGKSRAEAKSLLSTLFPDFKSIIDTEDFDKAINTLLESLKAVDIEAYNNLALALGKEGLADALKELKNNKEGADVVEKLSQSQIDRIASNAFKDATSGMSLRGYKYKSIGGIADIIKELGNLKFSDIKFDAETQKKIDAGAVSLADLQEVFERMKKEKTAEAANALAQHLKTLAKGIADLSESLVQYGEAAGNGFLKGLGEAVGTLSEMASTIAQGFASGGILGGAVAAVVYIGKELLNELTYAEQLRQKIAEVRLAKWRADMEDALDTDGFFGENGLQKLRASADVAAQAFEKLQSVTRGIDANSRIKTIDRGWLAEGWLGDKVEKLGSVAAKLGYDLYDAYGNINSEALQAILDTYDKLESGDRKWMEAAIAYAEEYKTALDALDEVTQSIFGDLASSAADAIVESWATAGDAALDYADILDDVAKRYAKMLVQSTLIDSVLTDDFKNELNALVGGGDVEGAMGKVADGMARIQAMAPQIQEILSPLVPYLNGNESGAESSLGNGIKSITEDTANLLAAYINGIRADVAAGNSQRAEILALVREYVGAGSAPSYTEYLTQIEAHTANLAANTNAILSELRSIITPESGLPAVRVQTA